MDVFHYISLTLVAGLTGALMAMRFQCARKQQEIDILRRQNARIADSLNQSVRTLQAYQQEAAYQQGALDGRKSDRIYRDIFKRLTRGERATVLMGHNLEDFEEEKKK